MSATAGLQGVWAHRDVEFSATFAPTVNVSQNRPFQIFRGAEGGRSSFSSPWHTGQSSADLPLRFGDQPVRSVNLGQSAVTLVVRPVALGVTSANEWWGPALRNTLILSNNAAGIPRLFLRNSTPFVRGVGVFNAELIVGTLTESPYFDSDASNDFRSISGALMTFRPGIDTTLTLGVSRIVIAPINSAYGSLSRGLDVITRWESIRVQPDSGHLSQPQQTDQMASLFARWIFPGAGFEAYLEWARLELPRSLRELLIYPQHTQGFTVGLQWADPRPSTAFLRIQAEISTVEQTTIIPGRPAPDFYSGRAAVQGFTQRGQILGAAMGPGGSNEFLAGDWLARGWQLGAIAGRTRTENDALFRQIAPAPTRHDVTIYSGLRGALRSASLDFSGTVTVGRRLNYLFQNDAVNPDFTRAIDVSNLTMTFAVAPR